MGFPETEQFIKTQPFKPLPGFYPSGAAENPSTESGQIGHLVLALAEAQAEFPAILKDTTNPFFKSKYADLAGLIKATQPSLAKHGLAVIQLTGTDFSNKAAVITTVLAHKTGQEIRSYLSIPVGQKFDAQTIGSAITYGRRYAYQAIIGVAAEVDDDGNSIAGPKLSEIKQKPSFYFTTTPSTETQPSGYTATYTYKNPPTGTAAVQQEVLSKPPKAKVPEGPVNINTNKNYAGESVSGVGVDVVPSADHEPTKEEKAEFVKQARVYTKELLPKLGYENPSDILQAYVKKLTNVSDTKKLTYLQWEMVLKGLDLANKSGVLKETLDNFLNTQ